MDIISYFCGVGILSSIEQQSAIIKIRKKYTIILRPQKAIALLSWNVRFKPSAVIHGSHGLRRKMRSLRCCLCGLFSYGKEADAKEKKNVMEYVVLSVYIIVQIVHGR